MTAAPEITVAETLEAEIRSAMAKLPKARGWDTKRVRDDELHWIDALLDEFNALGRS